MNRIFRMKYVLFLVMPLAWVLTASCSAQNSPVDVAGVMFYNTENLYDTINDPLKDDEEFLPGAARQWNTVRYEKKLSNLAKVITTGGNTIPTLLGLCEIENEQVLKDLIATPEMLPGNFGYVHYDSPDERGIDVALLYNKTAFMPIRSENLRVDLHADTVDYTRDILLVTGTINISGKKEPLHIFVNHWPSRSEGEEVSAPKRAAAASVLKRAIDSLFVVYKSPNIIIMGDFNDTPYDKSIQQILGAGEYKDPVAEGSLSDLMALKQKGGEGSYNYKGNWQALDQFIVSEGLLDNKKLEIDVPSVQFVKKTWMLYHSDKYGDSPDRTFAGTKYIGAYSDHLPIYMELVVK